MCCVHQSVSVICPGREPQACGADPAPVQLGKLPSEAARLEGLVCKNGLEMSVSISDQVLGLLTPHTALHIQRARAGDEREHLGPGGSHPRRGMALRRRTMRLHQSLLQLGRLHQIAMWAGSLSGS